jgi:hypothetical protein
LTDDIKLELDYTFIDFYHITENSLWAQMVIAVYFAFTSLSTVGFGDFCPRSDLERCLGAIMLLFGVAIFSMCMGKFLEMVDQMREFNSTLDDGQALTRFFGVIEKFNQGKPL